MENKSFINILKVVEPSLFSSAIVIIATVIFSVIAYIASIRPSSSFLNQSFYYFHNEAATNYASITNKLSSVKIINDMPLIIFWLLAGTIVYIIVIDSYRGVSNAVKLAEEWNYKNIKKDQFLKELVIHSILRILSLILLYVFMKIVISKVIPLDLEAIHKLSTAHSLSNIVGVLLTTLLLVIMLHVITVLIRLVLLRLRVFAK
ncbi:MAG: hypothetical protein ACYCPS_01800 [Candidatus Saccharimonadales bacterium]